jgi:hypothetical protein
MGSIIRKLFHWLPKNAQVTTAEKVNGHLVKVQDGSQMVDQVFCAALNIVQGLNGKRNGDVPDVEKKCKFLLKCAYEGSYLSAISHNRKKLFLTLIGEGSFGNKLKWIYDAILNAHLKWGKHYNNTIKKVTIVIYNSLSFYPPFIEKLRSNNIVYNIRHYHSGIASITDTFNPFKKDKKIINISKSTDSVTSNRDRNPYTGTPYTRPPTKIPPLKRKSTSLLEMSSFGIRSKFSDELPELHCLNLEDINENRPKSIEPYREEKKEQTHEDIIITLEPEM